MFDLADGKRLLPVNPLNAGLPPGEATTDRVVGIRLSRVTLPLHSAISDAKVLAGRQKPMTEIAFLFCELKTEQGFEGVGYSYSKRAGGRGQYAHACEIADALLGEDPSDIARLWEKMNWAGASVGRSGLATQALAAFDIALWDLKARRADLPLAKLLGAHRDSVRCYNTSGGFLSMEIAEVKDRVTAALDQGIGAIKLKVGQPDPMIDLQRIEAIRAHVGGNVPLAIDANQQWDRTTALRFGRIAEQFNLTWIEEPLDAYDAEGHAMLAAELATPIATGEMLTSVAEHWELIRHNAVDFIQPDAPRVGGITPFLKICALADHHKLQLAPHYCMEIHLHLTAAYGREPWVEHFEWSEAMFEHRLEVKDGRMIVPNRPGLGLTLSGQMRAWTDETACFGTGF
ncbi:L-talarate/galactarate dehydratase [Falsirhodobacter halotolerans]|uniref:L-talarate/galactarate dehydratase n=1 Tax=Falsirhodobacter halotolerans TaxID=1146892 RepID=UPI002453D2BF|nr:mandelate racemase/muconate lactonizing enzyme family protein [Falsirhodobacter halotolerans]